ncbi:MAG TPA: hypothetical protein VM165_02420, partial [Planctomycetaceae bacterium]|nr:hypothetical protein [Planctomycetaceae bacterium]
MSRRSGPSTASQRIGATDVIRTALLIVVGGLVTISWLSPTEGAIDGNTVPRAIVGMLVAAAWLMLPPLARRFAGRGVGGEGASDFSSLPARSVSDGGLSPGPLAPASGERVGVRG